MDEPARDAAYISRFVPLVINFPACLLLDWSRLAFSVSVLELETLKEAFLSSAEGGVLSRAQLASVFSDVGFGPVPSDRMFDLFDKDGNGSVSSCASSIVPAVGRPNGTPSLARWEHDASEKCVLQTTDYLFYGFSRPLLAIPLAFTANRQRNAELESVVLRSTRALRFCRGLRVVLFCTVFNVGRLPALQGHC